MRSDDDIRGRNDVAANVILAANVRMGHGNQIGPNCVIGDGVQLGDGNIIGAGSVLGGTSNHVRARGIDVGYDVKRDVVVFVGDSCVIGEMVTVHLPVVGQTTIGSGVSIGSRSHIAHDCEVDDDVNIGVNSTLGGYVHLQEGANLGLGATIHPRLGIGAFAMVGMGSAVVRHVGPFMSVAGNPARPIGTNITGMDRAGFSASDIAAVVGVNGHRPAEADGAGPRVAAALARFDAYLHGSFVRPVGIVGSVRPS